MISKPTFVSLGDPSGIGPEVFIKAIKDQRLRQHLSKIILVSSPKVIEGAISALDVKQKINPISDVNEAQPDAESHKYRWLPAFCIRKTNFQ